MGRRRIEIEPIKEERNRQVTLNKRKYGLMKKAYELSVLCGCEIGMIIVDSNNKQYLFGSHDISDTFQKMLKSGVDAVESHTNTTMAKLIDKREKRDGGHDAPSPPTEPSKQPFASLRIDPTSQPEPSQDLVYEVPTPLVKAAVRDSFGSSLTMNNNGPSKPKMNFKDRIKQKELSLPIPPSSQTSAVPRLPSLGLSGGISRIPSDLFKMSTPELDSLASFVGTNVPVNSPSGIFSSSVAGDLQLTTPQMQQIQSLHQSSPSESLNKLQHDAIDGRFKAALASTPSEDTQPPSSSISSSFAPSSSLASSEISFTPSSAALFKPANPPVSTTTSSTELPPVSRKRSMEDEQAAQFLTSLARNSDEPQMKRPDQRLT